MKANGIASELNKYFKIEFFRFQKLLSGLRKHGLFPDSRGNEIENHVTAIQCAHLLRACALNLNPVASDFEKQLLNFETLIDENGTSFISYLASLMSNSGENFYIEGVQRISFSLDRASVVVVCRNPDLQNHVRESGLTLLQLKETDKIFGERSLMHVERYAILKSGMLKKLALYLNETGFETTDADQSKRDQILDHINQ